MDNIHNISNRTLKWLQAGASKREYELRSEEGLFGQLKWEKPFGSLAAAVTADGEWTFKRSGFLHPSVSVRTSGSDLDLSLFRPNWSGSGALEFATSLKFSWVNKNFFRSEWAFVNQTGEEILRFKLKPSLLKLNVEIKVLNDLPELSLLACLGMYLLVLMHNDTAAATAAIVPVISVQA